PIRFPGRRVAITAPITGKARDNSQEKVWIEGEWAPSANRRARLPAEAATASPHAGHAIQDAVLLVMPEPAPRHIVAPADTRGERASPITGIGGAADSCPASRRGHP